MMIDHSHLRLGKRPRHHDARTLKLARYMTAALPPAPASADYTRGITDWGMMLNDQFGLLHDCGSRPRGAGVDSECRHGTDGPRFRHP